MVGAGLDYRIVPFRGEYLKIANAKSNIINSMIYPVPNLKYPFLGVHWTKKIDGSVAIGPNAVLAFGRESYRTWDVKVSETLGMLRPACLKMFFSREFASLALTQLRLSISKKAFLKEASRLVSGASADDLTLGKSGNRAQLINTKGELIDDLVVEERGNSRHVLNAVSPGFTSSLPFADFIAANF